MSDRIDNSKYRKAKLKELILKLHDGESQAGVAFTSTDAIN